MHICTQYAHIDTHIHEVSKAHQGIFSSRIIGSERRIEVKKKSKTSTGQIVMSYYLVECVNLGARIVKVHRVS